MNTVLPDSLKSQEIVAVAFVTFEDDELKIRIEPYRPEIPSAEKGGIPLKEEHIADEYLPMIRSLLKK